MDRKLERVYYSPQGYWKGISAIKKLADAAKVPEVVAKEWLFRQALWQIYLPAPRYIPRPKFDVPTPTKCIRLIFFSCRMTSWAVTLTNTHLPLLMLPADSKKLSL